MGNEGVWSTISNWTKTNWNKFTKWLKDMFNKLFKSKKHLQKEDFSKLNKDEKVIKSCDRISDAMDEFKKLH